MNLLAEQHTSADAYLERLRSILSSQVFMDFVRAERKLCEFLAGDEECELNDNLRLLQQTISKTLSFKPTPWK
jgi:hypothetical protein